jgi:hypothetical protein
MIFKHTSNLLLVNKSQGFKLLKKFSFYLIILLFFALGPARPMLAQDIYITQNTSGADTGVDCADAHSIAWLNNAVNWGTNAGQIGPGTTVHLCGVFNIPANTTGIVVQSSGTAANPITILFESGAILQSPYFPNNNYNEAAVVIMNQSYVTLDGGTNGLIQNTFNGSPGAACPGGACSDQQSSLAILASNCNNCEIKNLTIANFYVHTQCEVATGCDTSGSVGDGISISGSNWRVDNNIFHDIHWVLMHNYNFGDTNNNIDHNEFYNMDHGIIVSSELTCTATNDYIHDNYFHDMINWDSGAANTYHHDGIHAWNSAEDEGATFWGSFTGLYIYNNRFGGYQGNNCTAWIFLEGGYNNTGRTPWTSLFNSPNAFIYGNYFTNSDIDSGANVEIVCTGPGVVFNNTLVGPSDNGIVDIGDALSMGGTGPNGVNSAGLVVSNNLWSGEDTLIGGNSTDAYAMLPDYEYYGDYQSSYNPFWGFGVDTANFQTWQTACICDAHSTANPATLTAVVDANGMPIAGSWLLGKGQNMYDKFTALGYSVIPPGMGTDINGNTRPGAGQGNWDIGAYQYSTFTPWTPTPNPTPISVFAINNVLVYPNPMKAGKDTLYFNLNLTQQPQSVSIKIYTEALRLIKDKTWPSTSITGNYVVSFSSGELGNLANGMYFYILTAENSAGRQIKSKPGVFIVLR